MAINKLNVFYAYLPIMITTLLLESSETGMINITNLHISKQKK
jgi:hypothetical protein